jgi:hypothetical protein
VYINSKYLDEGGYPEGYTEGKDECNELAKAINWLVSCWE